MKVNTVLGSIDTSQMGFTLMHEHTINIDWCMVKAFPDFYKMDEVVDMFEEDMNSLKPYGLKTFVDPTPISLGRDFKLLQECSKKTGINIICCSGFYANEYPFMCEHTDASMVAYYLNREVTEGVEGSGIAPGFLKCCTNDPPGTTEINRQLIKGTAMVALTSGLPVYTHTRWNTKQGLWQKDILESEGVDPKKIAYGHTGGLCDMQYLKDLTENGSFVAFDQLTFFHDEKHYKFLADVLQTDMYKQVFISCDADLRSDYGMMFAENLRDRDTNRYVKKFTRRDRIFGECIPYLRTHGVKNEIISEVFYKNPRRFFGDDQI